MNFSKLLEDSMKVSPISNDFKIGNYNFGDIKIIENYYSNYFIYAISAIGIMGIAWLFK